jgi:hypothetical protein
LTMWISKNDRRRARAERRPTLNLESLEGRVSLSAADPGTVSLAADVSSSSGSTTCSTPGYTRQN